MSIIKPVLSGLLSGLIMVLAPQVMAGSNQKTYHIGISQIVEHPALDAVRQGALDELKNQGFIPGENLKVQYENAQGNMATSSQIASKLLGEKLDLTLAISTPSAQTLFFAAQKQEHPTPIVFSAVSDPASAKLISSSYPITGVSDAPNLEGLIEVLNKLMPNLKTLALMYNPAEANSVSTIANLKKLLAKQNIILHEVTVSKTADVAQAMHSLIGKVDALYFPQDNTVVAAIETVISIANAPASPLPVFSNVPILVKKGTLAAVGFDYYDVGKETGRVMAKILNGTSPNQIPIDSPKQLKAVINKTLAQKLGLKLPTTFKHSQLQLESSE